jgi:hypothetical protein
MPFTKVGKGKYRGPSGKTFTAAQVRLYYARGGTFKKGRKPRKARTKEERNH